MAENIKIDLLINAAQSAKTIGETKKALKDLKSEALNLKEGSAAFTRVATAAGELQDKIADLSATTKYLGDDLKNIKGISGIGEGIAGGFAMASGAAALFGGENKKLEESMVKLQAIMAVIQGMQAVGDVLQKQSAATLFIKNTMTKVAIALGYQEVAVKEADATATALQTGATELQTDATAKATIGQKLLNLAMKANPLGILIALITAGVAALMLWSNATSKSAEEEKKANEEKKKAAKLLKEQNDEKKKSSEYVAKEGTGYAVLAEQLKKTNPGSAERLKLMKEINKTYGTTLKNLKDEKEFQDQVSLSTKDYMEFLKMKMRLQTLGDLQIKATQKLNDLDIKLANQRAELERSIQLRKSMGYRDTGRDLRIALAFQYEAIAATEKEIKTVEDRFEKYTDTSNALTNTLSKNGLKLKDEIVETDKVIIKTTNEAIDKQEELRKAREAWLKAQIKLSEEERDELDKIEQQNIDNQSDGYDKEIAIAEKNFEDKKRIFNESGDALIADLEQAQTIAAEKAKLAGKELDPARVEADAAAIKKIRDNQAKYELELLDERTNAYNEAYNKQDKEYNSLREKSILEAIDNIDKIEKDALNARFSDETTRGEEYLNELNALNKRKEILIKSHDEYLKELATTSAEDMKTISMASSQVVEQILDEEVANELKILEEGYKARTDKTDASDAEFLLKKQLLTEKLYWQVHDITKQDYTISFGDTTMEYDKTKTYLENVALLYEKHYKNTTEIVTDANTEIATDEKDNDQKRLEEKEQFLKELVALEQQAQELMMAVFNNAMAQREYNINKEYDNKIEKIEAEKLLYDNAVADRTIQEQLAYDVNQGYENKKKDAQMVRDMELDKVKKKQFEAQKANDVATIAINTAVATAAAWKQPYVAPFVIPLILASGVMQAGVVLSKEYIPSFATGGLFQGNGMVNGPGTGTSDSVNAKLSNGESVINAKSTKLFGPILSAINQAGGGKAIPHLKNGGTFIEPSQPQGGGYLDTQAIVDAIYTANDRPIETYVKESSITTAQKNMQKLKNRTSF